MSSLSNTLPYANQCVVVKVLEASTSFLRTVKVVACTLDFPDGPGTVTVTPAANERAFWVANFRSNLVKQGEYYVVHAVKCEYTGGKMKVRYALDNQSTFLEFQ